MRVAVGAIKDFVIVRTDGTAYLPARDRRRRRADLEVTHVIRGEDHLTNSARQIALFLYAPGLRQPRFAHTALLVSEPAAKSSRSERAAPGRSPSCAASCYPPEACCSTDLAELRAP